MEERYKELLEMSLSVLSQKLNLDIEDEEFVTIVKEDIGLDDGEFDEIYDDLITIV